MSNDVKPVNAPTFAAKVIGSAALTVVLVLAGSIRSEAAPITLTYSNPGTSSQFFNFGDYSFSLSFQNVHTGSFDVTVNDLIQTPTALESRFGNFPGYLCVPFANGGTDCVDFEVTAPLPNQDQSVMNTWSGFFDITVAWFEPTDGTFSNAPGNRIRLLHNRGDVEGNGFDTDITVEGSYFSGCEICTAAFDDDPAIGGRDDNFQSFTVVQAPTAVPEPATMLLLGSGLIGAIQRRRRQLKPLSSSARTPRA